MEKVEQEKDELNKEVSWLKAELFSLTNEHSNCKTVEDSLWLQLSNTKDKVGSIENEIEGRFKS